MSLLLDTAELTYLNDKETEDPYHSEDESDDYNFKYVPANHFKYIVKDVRRQRCREEEENVWASFVKQQELSGLAYNKNDVQSSVQNIKELLDKGMRKADKELKRLETDILTDDISNEHDRTKDNQKRRSEVNNVRDSSLKKAPIMKDNGTDSINLLLTIPEEENTSIYEKRHESDNLKTYVRKSCSNRITRKRQSPKQLHHASNSVEYNSSPENTTRRNDDADGVIYVRPDPFVMHKILTMQRRICELLDEIAYRLVNIPAPDGIKDLQRRQQCAAEFAVRFSRNYLYDLNRYVKEIQRHMYIISPRARIKPNHKSLGLHMHAIEHKLLTTHQLLLHALVAYCNHIPSSILKGHPGKFREVLQVVIDLKTMCDRLHLNTNYLDSGDTDILSLGKDIESKCNAVLSKLKLQSDNDLLDSNKTPSIASFTSHSAYNKKRINRKQLSNRLSMYGTDTKVSKNYPKQKANYYHQKNKNYNRMDTKRTSDELVPTDRPYPSPVMFTSTTKNGSQVGIRKNRTYAKEEEIKTVMDMLPVDSDNGSNFESQERRGNMMFTRRPKTSKKLSSGKPQNLEQPETIETIVRTTSTNNDDELVKKVTMITEEHLSNLVPVIADLMSFVSNKQNGSEMKPVSTTSVKTLMEFLQRHQSPKSVNARISTDAMSCDVCHSSTDSSCECDRLKTNRTVIAETQRSGKNMRLICMSSVEDTLKAPKFRHMSCQVSHESLKESPDFEIKAKEETWKTDSHNNIELIVSEETEMNFFKYKNEYQRLTQSIPMYSSNTQNKPWDIVAWISDKLVDELITEVANEFVIEDVIQKLFDMEFREF